MNVVGGQPIVHKLKPIQKDGLIYCENLVCCDCGLSHYVSLYVEDDSIIEYYYRDEYDTGRSRHFMSDEALSEIITALQAEKRRRKRDSK